MTAPGFTCRGVLVAFADRVLEVLRPAPVLVAFKRPLFHAVLLITTHGPIVASLAAAVQAPVESVTYASGALEPLADAIAAMWPAAPAEQWRCRYGSG